MTVPAPQWATPGGMLPPAAPAMPFFIGWPIGPPNAHLAFCSILCSITLPLRVPSTFPALESPSTVLGSLNVFKETMVKLVR